MSTLLASALLSRPSSNAAPWRPPQWQQSPLFMITISGAQNAPAQTSSNNGLGGFTIKASGVTTQIYVFDAIMAADHRQEARVTEHPVQTGAVISDHAYILPAEIDLDIGMSDAMQQYAATTSASQPYALWTAPALSGPWGPGNGNNTNNSGVNAFAHSVNAYQTLISWMSQRVLMSLTTRLITYNNVMVVSVSPQEKAETIASLRCRVTFRQLFLASTKTYTTASNGGIMVGSSAIASARPQDTQDTGQGQTSSAVPSTAQTAQYGGKSGSTVLGAGGWSSNPSSVAA